MAPGESDDVEPDDLDRMLARIDAAARTVDAADVGAEPIIVELTVASAHGVASWFVRLDEHGGRADRGPATAPTVVIHIDDHTLADLRSGALDVPGAIDGGRLSVRGDLGALARARPALRALASALATPEDAPED
jgi:hypothetical protein